MSTIPRTFTVIADTLLIAIHSNHSRNETWQLQHESIRAFHDSVEELITSRCRDGEGYDVRAGPVCA